MHSNSSVLSAYSASLQPLGTNGPSDEYSVVQHVTRRLRQASLIKHKDYPRFVEALSLNRKLWTMFGADVAEPGNALPPDLRARIFYLSEYVDHHTRKVLQASADEAELIDLNETVMKGLKRQGPSR
jgi:flagellar protein FlaF